MSTNDKDLPHDAGGTESHAPDPDAVVAAEVAAELHHSAAPPAPLEHGELAGAAAPPAPPSADAPEAPMPPAPPMKKPLEEWARAKGVHPMVPRTTLSKRTGKPKTKLVRSANVDHHFYAGALAKWNWVPTMEVTEEEFDTEFRRAKYGVVLGAYPHPASVTKRAEARLAFLAKEAANRPSLDGARLKETLAGALPDVITTIADGGLGIVPPSSSNACVLIGSCAGGVANTFYGFNDPETLASTLLSGPTVELAAYMLSQPNHGTVYVIPCTCSTAGTCGGTTYARVAASIGTIVATGAALDAYQFVITIVIGEATVAGGGGVFTWSADGGRTTSPPTAIPTGGTFVVPGTGVTLTFTGAATAFSAGDVATISSTAPYYSGADFTTAFAVAKANPATWRFLVAVGSAASATAAATFASTLQSLMSAFEAANRYAYAFVQCNDTDANCITAFASFAGVRTAVAGGLALINSQISGRVYTRDALWAAAARIATRPVSEDAGRVATGALIGVSALLRDESVTPALDAARFITLRTLEGAQGFYITDGWTMAPTGSDFALLQNRQVMDVACTAARAAELKFLNDTVRVNGATVEAPLVPGGIYVRDAVRIQTQVNSAIRVALNIGPPTGLMPSGDATDSSVVVNQATDIIETDTIPITVRVVPMGYGKFIENNIGLQNPAFAAAA